MTTKGLGEERARLQLRIIRFLIACIPAGNTKPDINDIANYADAPVAEVHAVMTSMVRDGMLDWQMFYDCHECEHPNLFDDEQIESGIKNGSLGKCSNCGAELHVITAAPQLRPEYVIPLWWWSELLPPKIS